MILSENELKYIRIYQTNYFFMISSDFSVKNEKKWQKTTKIETPDDLPQEIIDEILEMWKDLKTGRAKDQQAKARMIDVRISGVLELSNKRQSTKSSYNLNNIKWA